MAQLMPNSITSQQIKSINIIVQIHHVKMFQKKIKIRFNSRSFILSPEVQARSQGPEREGPTEE